MKIMKTIVELSLIAAFTLPFPTLAADKKTTRTFNAASNEIKEKVQEMIKDDRAKAFAEFVKGARALVREFPGDVRPFMMMAQASGLAEDKKDATQLKEQAEAGILAILEKDKKNKNANKALLIFADSAEPEQAKAYLRQIIENADGGLAEEAKSKLKYMETLGQPVEISFEAVDGRKVDVAKLKGKVVLIDFWATWCRPCVAELPSVKKTYTKYHKKGFEIIGISLDSNKNKLTNFVEDNNMPWAQYFDGQRWENKFAKEFGIQGIPAMWLIDKKGNLVDMKASTDLEAKVEKLLGIE